MKDIGGVNYHALSSERIQLSLIQLHRKGCIAALHIRCMGLSSSDQQVNNALRRRESVTFAGVVIEMISKLLKVKYSSLGKNQRGHNNLPRAGQASAVTDFRSEEHTSELQSRENLVCR